LPAAGAGSPPPLVPSLATMGGLQRRPATPQRRAPSRPIENRGLGAPQSVNHLVRPHSHTSASAPSREAACHWNNSYASTAASLGSSSRLLVPNQLCYGAVSKTPSPATSKTASPKAHLQQSDGEPHEHESCIVTPNSASKKGCPKDVIFNHHMDILNKKVDELGLPKAPPPTPEKRAAVSAKLSEAMVTAASSAQQRFLMNCLVEAVEAMVPHETGSEQSSQTPVPAVERELTSPMKQQQQQRQQQLWQQQEHSAVLEDGDSSAPAPATPSAQRYQQQTLPRETAQHQRLFAGTNPGSCSKEHDSRHELSPLSLGSVTSSPARASPQWRDQQGLSPLLASVARTAATSW